MVGRIRFAGVLLSVAAMLLGSGTAAEAAGGHGGPVDQPAPSTAPTSAAANGTCTTPGVSSAPPSTSTEQLMWVDPRPTTLTAVWLPGLNAKQCVAQRTVSSRQLARKVAAAVERAKAFPTGALPCPFDDNTSVRLYFGYRSGSDEYADVSLSGCRPISAPGRASRWNDIRVEKALLPAAPAAWQSSLGGAIATPDVAAPSKAPVVTHGTPVNEPAPPVAPLTTKHDGVCTVESSAPHGGNPNPSRLLWLHRKPKNVVGIWIPGANDPRCVAIRTLDGSVLAHRIAVAVRNAPAFPRGIFCPRDDGSAVRLYLSYPNGDAEYVNVELSGCHSVSAPGRSPREITPALSRALRAITPAGFGTYFN